ncbi:MAG TPA: riboflavin biosynthesis protein RibF [Candidatus Acidoferrales bacterium]|nr:riboflavin biosynthesis protein RibF [Candidatus Acidoferrales bacterium]
MTVVHDFGAWPKGPLSLAIGVFDGVHLGHQTVVRETAAQAHRAGATAVICTFDPLPIEVLAPGAPPSALTDIDERCRLLERAGADAVAVIHFTRELSLLTPAMFVESLARAGEVRSIRVGEDFRFGHDRAGNVAVLRDMSARFGYELVVADPVLDGERVVSSTRIRNALLAGELAEAERLLGRRYVVRGVVVSGDPHGRALGFPTVDLAVRRSRLLPRDGIYAGWASSGADRLPAAASLSGDRHVELYLLERPATRLEEPVELEFVSRLRDELRFDSPAEASAQIAKDVDDTRRALAGG